jgi:cytochrome b561
LTSWLLLGLVLLHFGAALYHQFIRKDNLLARMWFGK